MTLNPWSAAVATLAFGSAAVSIIRWCRRYWFPLCPVLRRQPPLRRKLRVAVLGGGVGGTALAHWLRELYGDDLDLTLICDGPIGGRCQSVHVAGRRYEGGAAIISELNEYLRSFLRKLRLKEKFFASVNIPLGVYDGTFLVREADPEREAPLGLSSLAELVTIGRFARRYGLRSLLRLKGLLRHPAAPNFERLYRELACGRAFDTPEQLLQTLGPDCLALTRERAASWLCREQPSGGGVGRQMVDELVSTGMRCNYGGQGCEEMHAFCGLVSVAGGLASRCFAVRGGNAQVPQGLLGLAAPQQLLLHSTARAVRRAATAGGSEGWMVDVEEGAAAEAMKGAGSPPAAAKQPLSHEGPYDVVVLAHPLERSCVQIEGGGELQLPAAESSYRRCVTHFVRGVLRARFFQTERDAADGTAQPLPAEILTVDGAKVPFYSIGLQLPVDVENAAEAHALVRAAMRGGEAMWKLFAPEPLSAEQLDDLFDGRVGEMEVLDWYAYPEYAVPQKLSSFVLNPGEGSLLYLNAIEQTASAMEMSIISARNAANLVTQFVDRCRMDKGGSVF
jgi:prenylcysteine oxidase/farnesylcysteine lyase